MKTTLTWAIAAAILGAAAGAALGYWEARPWAMESAGRRTADANDRPQDAQHDAPQAVAAVDETTYNFGKMESGATQRRAFPIRNAGRIPLTVEFVSHTCKCTEVLLDGQHAEPGVTAVVKPGEQIEVVLEWEAPPTAGPFRHGATFTTNDPARSRLELTVEGDVVESTTLEPSILSFGTVQVGQAGRAEVYVMSFLEPGVEVLSHEVRDAKLAEQVKVTVEPVAKEQLPDPKALAGVKIVAEYQPKAIGPFSGSLKATTNLKQAPTLIVPISGLVKGDITIFGNNWIESTGMLRMDPGTTATGTKSRLSVTIRGEHAQQTTQGRAGRAEGHPRRPGPRAAHGRSAAGDAADGPRRRRRRRRSRNRAFNHPSRHVRGAAPRNVHDSAVSVHGLGA
ncbi:MAG: hypothetical protein DCC67_12740 [Planctomycetota bacterium]|nr:MAG: hypothetical protein DCC67_12740 [Planctomycetota bacterium]